MKPLSLLTVTLPLTAAPASNALGLPSAGSAPATSAMQIVLVLTALTFLPALIVSLTPFLRITVVLHFLRQALGTQTAPSNQVLLGLSLFLSFLIMQPILSESYSQGWQPYEQGKLSGEEAWEQGSRPVKKFLLRFAREKDIALFIEISKSPAPRSAQDLDLKILAPAYVLSELRAGFQIGAVIFLPFLVIDLVVASIMLSIGMVQLPPIMISAPFKILLFVLVDGWNLVVGSLMKSFA
jgi:flagellar biosynthetic protein FliP